MNWFDKLGLHLSSRDRLYLAQEDYFDPRRLSVQENYSQFPSATRSLLSPNRMRVLTVPKETPT
jgi:hypothetical protein